jgi:hypothetical protein
MLRACNNRATNWEITLLARKRFLTPDRAPVKLSMRKNEIFLKKVLTTN